jgi:hypothetical protein
VEGGQAEKEAYLGYSVIRPTKPNCIGRTLLTHRLRLDSCSHLSVCEESVHIFGTRFQVEGFPFISQDVDATVCAQSALWMLFRYYSNRYPIYSEILPFQITSLADRHAGGYRVYPSAGLYPWQLAEALRLQRFAPVLYSRKQFGRSFDHLLYTYIESGLPLLVVLPEHVVVSYGHVSDYGRSVGAASLGPLYSSFFNRGFVISDDNHFPYQLLFQKGVYSDSKASSYEWDQIEEFIVPLPEKVFLTAEQAQTAIETLLKHPKIGLASSPTLQGRELIRRLYLTSARAYKRTLHRRGMGNPLVEKIYRTIPMSHFIWVCEIADRHAYANTREILGEVIWDATRNAHEPDGCIALHFPENLAIDVGSALNGRAAFKNFSLEGSNSYLLFDSNLCSL